MAVVSMSKQEFSRLEVLLRVQSGRLRVSDACVLIGLQRRQVFRLLRGLKRDGATSLLSKRRGKPSNHRLPAEVRILALSIVRERYADFGPTLAAEKLAEHHGCSVSRETLRGWMIADGLWQDRRHRLPSPHQPRRRRDCLGELVQIDGSEHAWFEDRGPPCTMRRAGCCSCGSSPRNRRLITSGRPAPIWRRMTSQLKTEGLSREELRPLTRAKELSQAFAAWDSFDHKGRLPARLSPFRLGRGPLLPAPHRSLCWCPSGT